MAFQKLSKEDKDEMVSDTFFILWKNRQVLEEDKLLSSYLAGIARNLVKEKIRKKVIPIYVSIEDYENSLPDTQKIDMLWEQREEIRKVKQILMKMKPADRDLFSLYYNGDKSCKQIANLFGTSEFSVKSKIYRIRKKIRKELEKGGYSNG